MDSTELPLWRFHGEEYAYLECYQMQLTNTQHHIKVLNRAAFSLLRTTPSNFCNTYSEQHQSTDK